MEQICKLKMLKIFSNFTLQNSLLIIWKKTLFGILLAKVKPVFFEGQPCKQSGSLKQLKAILWRLNKIYLFQICVSQCPTENFILNPAGASNQFNSMYCRNSYDTSQVICIYCTQIWFHLSILCSIIWGRCNHKLFRRMYKLSLVWFGLKWTLMINTLQKDYSPKCLCVNLFYNYWWRNFWIENTN